MKGMKSVVGAIMVPKDVNVVILAPANMLGYMQRGIKDADGELRLLISGP